MKPKSTLTVGDCGAINRAALFFVILLSTMADSATAQDFARWRYYRAINFNTSESGANVKGDVRNYPVAVALNASNFDFSQSRPDGADIRFSTLENGSENGAMAPHSIEHWDQTKQTALLWVKVPTVRGATSSQSIFMH